MLAPHAPLPAPTGNDDVVDVAEVFVDLEGVCAHASDEHRFVGWMDESHAFLARQVLGIGPRLVKGGTMFDDDPA